MKVCIVGGGSTYTPELVEGLLDRRGRLGVERIHLHDLDAARLEVLGPLARRMAEAASRTGEPVRVDWGTDRRAALAGSEFVVSQMRVGGMAARERDEQLGREFDLVGQETVGVGGLANAWRTVPVAWELAADLAEVAPGATLLNFTNPAGLVTEALVRHPSVAAGAIDTIGLCNIPWTVRARIARRLGVEATSVRLESVGLNHLTWIRRVIVDGDDRTEEVLAQQVLSARRHERSADDPGGATDPEPAWSAEELERYAAIPNPYLRYFDHTTAWIERQRRVPTRAAEVARIEAALLRQYADPGLDRKPPELAQRGGAHYSEAAAELMADLVEARAGRWADHPADAPVHVVNVPNRGAVPDLDDVVVEVAARIDAAGPVPLTVDPIRAEVRSLIEEVKRAELLAIEAAASGDATTAIEALVAHPLGPDRSTAPAVWRRLCELNAGFLGRLEPR